MAIVSIVGLVRKSICVVSILVCLTVLASGGMRAAFKALLDRSLARIVSPTYVFVGDSLTVQCALHRRLTQNPFLASNLAAGGADVRTVAGQIRHAAVLRPEFLVVAAGVNDVIIEHAPAAQIAYDFQLLLNRIPKGQKAVLTLIPHVSDAAFSAQVNAANAIIVDLATERGLPIIDLNPDIAVGGLRNSDMTQDGVHFTERACRIWAKHIADRLSRDWP